MWYSILFVIFHECCISFALWNMFHEFSQNFTPFVIIPGTSNCIKLNESERYNELINKTQCYHKCSKYAIYVRLWLTIPMNHIHTISMAHCCMQASYVKFSHHVTLNYGNVRFLGFIIFPPKPVLSILRSLHSMKYFIWKGSSVILD